MIRRYRIVDKTKFVSFLVSAFIMFTFIVFLLTNNRVYSSIYEEAYIEVEVKKGDTLWKIAMDNMPLEYDVRKMVFEIIKFNNMNSADIYPGQLIKVPIKHNSK